MVNKKYLISFGTLIVATAPVVTVISCGDGDQIVQESIYGDYTEEQVNELKDIPGQIWEDGEPKYITNTITGHGEAILNPEFPDITPEQRNEVLAQLEPGNEKDADGDWKISYITGPDGLPFRQNLNPEWDPIDELSGPEIIVPPIIVVEDQHTDSSQHDISKWPFLSLSEQATILSWSDEQFSQFTRLINGETVNFNGANLTLVNPIVPLDQSTEISIVQRAFDIVVSNGVKPVAPLVWRELQLDPSKVPASQPGPTPPPATSNPPAPTGGVQTPPPLTNNQPGPSGQTQPPALPPLTPEQQILLDFGVTTKVPTARSLPAESASWTNAEKAVYKWYLPFPPGTTMSIYIARQYISTHFPASVGNITSSDPAWGTYISGPLTPPLPPLAPPPLAP